MSLDRIEQPERLLGWLRTTTWRACINHVNTRAAELVDSSVLDSFESSHFDDPADAVVREETCRTIRRSVSGLGSVGGRVLDRQLLDPDERYRDMSEAWSIPIGSLGPERKRAIERLGRTPEVLALR